MSVDPASTRRLIESLSTHLEDHLATWKSSLVDARRDIESLLAAISDRIPAQAKPLFPEDIVALMLEDAAPAAASAPRAAAPAAPAPPPQADWTVVRGSLAAVESARTQVDVLSRFLAQTQAHASRVALLVLRNDRLTGWKSVGYDATGGRDETVRAVDLSSEEDPFVAAVLKAQRSMLAEPPDESSPLRRALSGPAPAKTLLVPMVIRDRLAGLVCADELPGEEGRLNEAAIEVLTFVTGLAVDLLAARKKIPSPTLTPTGEKIARLEVVPPGATMRMPAASEPDRLSMAGPGATIAPPPAPPPAPAAPPASSPTRPAPDGRARGAARDRGVRQAARVRAAAHVLAIPASRARFRRSARRRRRRRPAGAGGLALVPVDHAAPVGHGASSSAACCRAASRPRSRAPRPATSRARSRRSARRARPSARPGPAPRTSRSRSPRRAPASPP